MNRNVVIAGYARSPHHFAGKGALAITVGALLTALLFPAYFVPAVLVVALADASSTLTGVFIAAYVAVEWFVAGISHPLERAVVALLEGELPVDLRAEAEREAHKLAGGVGTYGFRDAAAAARRAEEILAGVETIRSADVLRLSEAVVRVRDELEQPAGAAAADPDDAGEPGRPDAAAPPRLLAVGLSDEYRDRLTMEVEGRGMELVELEVRELLNEYDFPGDDVPIVMGSALKALEAEGEGEAAEPISELMDAIDSYIPQPERDIDRPFLMPVEDVFSITGRGTVATGRVERGIVKQGEEVELVGMGSDKKTVVTGVEMFRKLLDEGVAGDNVGLLLRGVGKEEIERGMVLAKPGSITPHTKFKAEVYVLTKEEGGRHTPFFNGYRPQFYFRTTDVTGSAMLPEGVEMVMPGDNVQMEVELISPIAMEKELRFAIREGGRTVGAGVVTEIIE